MLYIFIDESGIHKETGKSSVAQAYISFENLNQIQNQVTKIEKEISVKKLKTGNDQSYPALRIADAIAGIVRYKNDNPENKDILPLYDLIKDKISITLEE